MVAVLKRTHQPIPHPAVDMIVHGDALEEIRRLPSASVDAIITDPPYYRVKSEHWDRQWDSPRAFLAWMAALRDEWARLLKPNGSLYCFASPKMAARVEVMLGERFNVLNRIRWVKSQGWHKKARQEDLRSYLSPWEEIVFAELPGSDSMALGESGYAAQCERLHGFVFEPLRAYLEGERKRAGIEREACNVACGTRSMAARHYFTTSQWCLPTTSHYAALQRLFNEQGRRPAPPFADFHPHGSPFAVLHAAYEYLRADYEYLRADYEELRADYEELRRPFQVTADVPYTDVWDFPTVASYPGKHPCEKPSSLLQHIIRSSTRPGALILDCFAGTGSLCLAARSEGRHYIAIEREAQYVETARTRLATSPIPLVCLRPRAKQRKHVLITPSLWELGAATTA